MLFYRRRRLGTSLMKLNVNEFADDLQISFILINEGYFGKMNVQ
jgi:hypothetical protein